MQRRGAPGSLLSSDISLQIQAHILFRQLLPVPHLQAQLLHEDLSQDSLLRAFPSQEVSTTDPTKGRKQFQPKKAAAVVLSGIKQCILLDLTLQQECTLDQHYSTSLCCVPSCSAFPKSQEGKVIWVLIYPLRAAHVLCCRDWMKCKDNTADCRRSPRAAGRGVAQRGEVEV